MESGQAFAMMAGTPMKPMWFVLRPDFLQTVSTEGN